MSIETVGYGEDVLVGSTTINKFLQNIGVKRISGDDLTTLGVQPKWLYFIEDISCAAVYVQGPQGNAWFGLTGYPVAGNSAQRDQLIPYEGQRYFDTEQGVAFQYLGGSWTGEVAGNILRPAEYVLVGNNAQLALGRKYLVYEASIELTLWPAASAQNGHAIWVHATASTILQTPVWFDGVLYNGNDPASEWFPIQAGTMYHFAVKEGEWFAFSSIVPTEYIQELYDDIVVKYNEIVEVNTSISQTKLEFDEVVLELNEKIAIVNQQSETIQLQFEQIELWHLAVSQNATQVAQDKTEVEQAKAFVQNLAEQVDTQAGDAQDAAFVATDASIQAAEDAVLASKWASNPRNQEVASQLFSALHYMLESKDYRDEALQAAQALAGGLSFAGAWDASGGTWPPLPSEGSVLYKIDTAGTIEGKELAIGDSIIYDASGTQWLILRTSQVIIIWDEIQNIPPVVATLEQRLEELEGMAVLGW